MHARSSIKACAVVSILAAALAPTAHALTCADRFVKARGEPSRFETLAKAKARGNWRAQIRAMPALGAQYSNWSTASDAAYECEKGQGGYTCTAAARPCRK